MLSICADSGRLCALALAPCLLAFAMALALAGCTPTEKEVAEEIDAANHCTAASECRDLGPHCPFGCTVLVHESETIRILELITDYADSNEGQQCMYSCLAYDALECQEGRCVAVITN